MSNGFSIQSDSKDTEAKTFLFKCSLDELEPFNSISFCYRGKDNAILEPSKCYSGPVPISKGKKKTL